jgi:hypothetical protein
MNISLLPKTTALAAVILLYGNACSNPSPAPDAVNAAPAATTVPSASAIAAPPAASAGAAPAETQAAAGQEEEEKQEQIQILPGLNSAERKTAETAEDNAETAAGQPVAAPFEEELEERRRKTELLPPSDDLEDEEPVGNILKIPL